MSLGGGRIGEAWYELELRDQGFLSALKSSEAQLRQVGDTGERAFGTDLERGIDEATRAADKLDRELDGLNTRGSSLSGTFGKIDAGVMSMTGGLGVAGVAAMGVGTALGMAGNAIDLASDKAEASSKAQVLFGDAFGIVEEAAGSAAETVGLSSGAYLAAAGDVGNLIVNFGIAGEAGANMSKDIVQLAADMGSFNNASTVEVTEAIGAAFRGETEPISRFGVILNAASIQAKAVQMGLIGVKDALTPAARVQASYALIVEQTSKAQGDFARTSDGYANSQRIAAAKTEEALTQLGEALMPLAASIMPLIAEGVATLVGGLTALADAIGPLVDGALGAVADAIDAVGQAWTDLQNLMDPEGTEWERVTAEIIAQADALGLNGEAVAAYADQMRRARDAELERARIRSAVIEQDRIIAQVVATAREEIDAYYESVGHGITAEQADTMAKERKLQLNTQLIPFLAERNRLLGIEQEALAAVTIEESESAEITGRAAAAVEAYNLALQNEKDRLDALSVSIGANRDLYTQAEVELEGFVSAFERLSKANPGGGTEWSAFLIENVDLISRRFEELPEWIQTAVTASGLELRKLVPAASEVGSAVTSSLGTEAWTSAIVDPIMRGSDFAIAAIGALGPGMREQLKSAEEQVKEAMRDLRWAIANPKAWEQTIRTIENAIEDSEARENAARRAGNLRTVALEQAQQARLEGIWSETTMLGERSGRRLTERRNAAMRSDEGPKLWRRLTAEEQRAMLALVPKAERAGADTADGYGDGTKRNSAKAPRTWEDMTGKQRRAMLRMLREAGPAGADTTGEYGGGMARNAGRAPTIAQNMAARVKSPLVTLQGQTYAWGSETARQYANGLASGVTASRQAAIKIANAAGILLESASPPKHPDNPLRNVVRWGRSTMEAYGDGIASARPYIEGKMIEALSVGRPGNGGSRIGAMTLEASTVTELRVRHEIDLRNAPPGVTSQDVAGYVNAVDSTVYLRNLRQAALLPATLG
jgi:hypothetical protein